MGEYREPGIVVYGLAGIGAYLFSQDIKVTGGFSENTETSNDFFNFQIGAGASYEINSAVSVYLEPKYAICLVGSNDEAGNAMKMNALHIEAGLRLALFGEPK